VEWETYRGVNWLIALHVAVLASSVMDLAERDTWDTVGDAALLLMLAQHKNIRKAIRLTKIDRRAAAEERVGPSLSTFSALGVDSLASVS
jgi:hypothetical protein